MKKVNHIKNEPYKNVYKTKFKKKITEPFHKWLFKQGCQQLLVKNDRSRIADRRLFIQNRNKAIEE